MKVLVTGATGFIGYSLVPVLEAAGHEVHQMVRYRSGRWDGYAPGRVHFADLRDFEAVQKAVMDVRPEIVVHLGAVSAVSYSFGHEEEVIQVNYMGTRNLASACMRVGVQCFIHASTSEVYGTTTEYPTKETAPLGATSPYAASKIAAEEYLRTMHSVAKFPMVIIRPFNSYGRALVDNRHFVVERAICGALLEGKISLHDPRPERDFMFRDDHVRAYEKAVERQPIGETINLCTGGCWTIKEMAETVANLLGGIPVDFLHAPDRPLDIPRLQGDNTKTRELLGWVPSYGLVEGLRQAIKEWKERFNV